MSTKKLDPNAPSVSQSLPQGAAPSCQRPVNTPDSVLDPAPAEVSPIESLLEGLAQSPLYGPLLGPAVRRRQFERRELRRQEEIAQAEHERKLAEIRGNRKSPEPLPDRKVEKPLRKSTDLSSYLDASSLTERQREILSLRLEYGLSVTDIAGRLQLDRTTVAEHIKAGKRKVDMIRARETARKNEAKSRRYE